jgi:TonB family protein
MEFAFSALLAISSFLPIQEDAGVRVAHTRPPVPPVNTLAAGLVVVDLEIESAGKIQARVVQGEPPFVASALESLKGWQFVPASHKAVDRTSVTFLFRAPAIYAVNVGSGSASGLDGETPALPLQVIDPGYPPASLVTGSVIFELRISASGQVVSAKVIHGVKPLTEKAQEAIKQWTFSPAKISGRAAPGTTFVVISFVLPVLSSNPE